MKAKDLIKELQELDPDEEIYIHDMSYGTYPASGIENERKIYESGADYVSRIFEKVWTVE